MCLYRVYNVLINSIVESKKLRRDADRLRLKILTELWKIGTQVLAQFLLKLWNKSKFYVRGVFLFLLYSSFFYFSLPFFFFFLFPLVSFFYLSLLCMTFPPFSFLFFLPSLFYSSPYFLSILALFLPILSSFLNSCIHERSIKNDIKNESLKMIV